MKLGRTLYTDTGSVLAGAGFTLTESVIGKLQRMGFNALWIDEPGTTDIRVEDTIREQTRMTLCGALTQMIGHFGHSFQAPQLNSYTQKLISEAIDLLIEDVRSHRSDMIAFSVDAGRMSSRFMDNAINVCVSATKIGIQEGFAGESLRAVSLAGMLHDVGMLMIEDKQRNGETATENAEAYRKHTQFGYMMLQQQSRFSPMCSIYTLQHHERIDGSGFPNRLKGDDIHHAAQWIGLIDEVDQSIRRGMLPHSALEMLYANAGTAFDIRQVEKFRNTVAIFPPGTSVRLSSGEIGIVSKVHPHNKQRPIVRVVKNEWGEEMRHPFEVDLATSLNVMIDGIGCL